MLVGHSPNIQGEQADPRPVNGQPPQLWETFTGHFCGNPQQWAGNLVSTNPADVGKVGCCNPGIHVGQGGGLAGGGLGNAVGGGDLAGGGQPFSPGRGGDLAGGSVAVIVRGGGFAGGRVASGSSGGNLAGGGQSRGGSGGTLDGGLIASVDRGSVLSGGLFAFGGEGGHVSSGSASYADGSRNSGTVDQGFVAFGRIGSDLAGAEVAFGRSGSGTVGGRFSYGRGGGDLSGGDVAFGYGSGKGLAGGGSGPAPVTGISVGSATSSSLRISWTQPSGTTTANVYRSTSSTGPFTLVGGSVTSPFTNSGLSASTTYYYVVRAVDSSGEAGISIGVFSGTTTAAGPSVAQSSSAGANGATSLTVTWSNATTSGDLLVVVFAVNANVTILSAPTGYSFDISKGGPFPNGSLYLYHKVESSGRSAGATDTWTFNVAPNHMAYVAAEFTGSTSWGTDAQGSTSAASDTNPNASATTTTHPEVGVFACCGDTAGVTYSSPSGGYSIIGQQPGSGATRPVNLCMMWVHLTTTGATSPGITASASEEWAAVVQTYTSSV